MKTSEFEKYLNIETEGDQQGFPKKLDYHRYEPTPYKAVEQLFDEYVLPTDAVCVDIGCGKGRVPIYIHEKFHVAAKGIEMDPKFFAAAEYNLQQYKAKHPVKHGSIEFLHEIAEQHVIEQDENVFFFFNPFSINIFRKVFRNIVRSAEQHPREIYFIFYYPSPDYLEFLFEQAEVMFHQEVSLTGERNKNERIFIFKM